MASQMKILVAGDVDGKIDKLFKKVSNVQAKSNFDVLLCCGSFFGQDGEVDASWDDYLSGKLQVPIETYILGPTTEGQLAKYRKVKRGGDLCDNLTYLGQQGVCVMPSGLKVAYLSGAYDKDFHDLEDLPEPRVGYAKADVDSLVNFALRPSYSGVDIFLSGRWPSGVCNGLQKLPTDQTGPTSICPGSAAATAALRPRYHFAGSSPEYFERPPYSNSTPGKPPSNATRFYGMAPVANPTKQKWIYAFNIEPMSKADPASVMQVPTGLTQSPYAMHSGPSTDSFFFGAQMRMGKLPPPPPGAGKRKREGDGYSRPPKKPTGPCWFCLMSPQVEKHLVTCVAEKIYIALAKGSLVPEHALLLPIQHIPASAELEDDIRHEIKAHKAALRHMFKEQGKACVFWERNIRSQHLQVQVCPVPIECADRVEQAFIDRGKALNQDFSFQVFEAGAPLPEGTTNATPYLLVELPDGRQLFHQASGGGFPLQFAREALASSEVLNMPDRADWTKCKLDKDTETVHAKSMRSAYKPFKPAD